MSDTSRRGDGIESSEGGIAVDSGTRSAGTSSFTESPVAPPERMGMDRDTTAEGYAETPQGLETDAARLIDDDTAAVPEPASPFASQDSAEVIRSLDEEQIDDTYAGGPVTYVDDPAVARSDSQRVPWSSDEGRDMHDGEPGYQRHAGRQRGTDWTSATLAFGAAALMAGGLAMVARARKQEGRKSPNDAPEHAMKARSDVIGFTLAIMKSPEELYRRWREQSILVQVMENVRSIEPIDDTRSRWTMRGPFGADVSFISHITADEPNRRIAWKAEGNPVAAHQGEVLFIPAPQGHGTYVRVFTTIPYGTFGKIGATVTGMSPVGSLRRDLRRFKQIMEAGERATNGRDD